jgi:biopolymer transport protein ExbD
MLRVIVSFLLMGCCIAVAAETQKPASTNPPVTTPAGTPITASAIAAATPPAIVESVPFIPITSPTIATAQVAADAAVLDTDTIEKITGIKGKFDKQSNSFKIAMPRNDLNIVVNGVKLSSAMGLTSWAVFKKTANTLTVKADLVVTENQVNTILSMALDNGLAVIALHNHLLWESPKVMFIHVEGVGDETKLAEAVHLVFAKTMDTTDEASDFPLASIDTTDTTLNTEKVENIMGARGRYRNGVYQILVSKYIQIKTAKGTVKAPIINTAVTFAGSDGEAVIDGDLALRASDLHDVLDALHKVGIAVVALHQHESINSQTRVIYLHYFGVGKSATLARGVRKALDMAKTKAETIAKPSIALLIPPASPIKSQLAPTQATARNPKKTEG